MGRPCWFFVLYFCHSLTEMLFIFYVSGNLPIEIQAGALEGAGVLQVRAGGIGARSILIQANQPGRCVNA